MQWGREHKGNMLALLMSSSGSIPQLACFSSKVAECGFVPISSLPPSISHGFQLHLLPRMGASPDATLECRRVPHPRAGGVRM